MADDIASFRSFKHAAHLKKVARELTKSTLDDYFDFVDDLERKIGL